MDEYLVQPLRDFVMCFERLDIPYALMGGIAVGAHGIPRPTHDQAWAVKLSVLERLKNVRSQYLE